MYLRIFPSFRFFWGIALSRIHELAIKIWTKTKYTALLGFCSTNIVHSVRHWCCYCQLYWRALFGVVVACFGCSGSTFLCLWFGILNLVLGVFVFTFSFGKYVVFCFRGKVTQQVTRFYQKITANIPAITLFIGCSTGNVLCRINLTKSCTRQFTRCRLCDVRCAHIVSHKRQRVNCEWAWR